MISHKGICGFERRAVSHSLGALFLTMLFLNGAAAAQLAIEAAPPVAVEQASPSPKIRELVNLLADPAVQQWLKQQNAAKAAATADRDAAESSISHVFETRLVAIHEHIVALAQTIPDLPNQFWQGRARVTADLGKNGRVKGLLLLSLFIVLGSSLEWLFRLATRRVRAHLDALPSESVQERLSLVALRFAFAVGIVVTFALGSIGPFLVFGWPPLLREMLFGYLIAFLVLRTAGVVGHFLLSTRHERFRVIPMDTAAARFWQRRLVLFVGWFAFGWVTVGFGVTLGYSVEGRELIAYALGLGLVAIALEAVWRRPAPVKSSDALFPAVQRFGRGAANTALSCGVLLLWLLWVLHAMASLWFVFVVIALPLAIGIARRAVDNLLLAPGDTPLGGGSPSVLTVCIERGIRAVLIISAVAALVWGWDIDLARLRGQETLIGLLAEGALSTIVILLIADLLWHAAKTAIDHKLAETEPSQPHTDEARRRTRLRTLLPIFRNVLAVAILVIAAMMALAAWGVQIGPLIAGAGVVGVAIGFGAQSFVRDVIAGIFYLMDDAFRVGEYIQAGNYKGTVEGFSIRSVKLRHHRGPVYTVPFSLLGAVQNQSRDWVIDKLSVGITYDSDLERARKLIKQIGVELKNNPDFAPLIIEPLKMQGVEKFGDFAIQIRLKMMTLPGEQFVIRRKAYAMIKKAFDENGIKFAFPTVQIAAEGDAASSIAAAQSTLELTRPAA